MQQLDSNKLTRRQVIERALLFSGAAGVVSASTLVAACSSDVVRSAPEKMIAAFALLSQRSAVSLRMSTLCWLIVRQAPESPKSVPKIQNFTNITKKVTHSENP